MWQGESAIVPTFISFFAPLKYITNLRKQQALKAATSDSNEGHILKR